MVKSPFTALGLLALLSQGIMAAPATVERGAVRFSFADWVEGIISDPSGDHLSPEEAVAAFRATSNNTLASARASLVQSQAACYEHTDTDAYIPDAVICINALATRPSCPDYVLCQYRRAILTADGNHTASCKDCARTAGLILDQCTRAGSDWVEGADWAVNGDWEFIRIRRPYT